jgi:CDP-diacylglycerol--glycerol-3-phosphate 3-phosphatidyltransferase
MPLVARSRAWPSCASGPWAAVATWANVVTVLRTVVCVPLALTSVVTPSRTLLLGAYAVYWVGDVVDGHLARRLDQETRIGAVLDVVGDRACSCVLVCALVVQQPRLWAALAVYLVQFMLVDAVLTLSFLRWPLLSPNYFYCVDRTLWRWNWSPPAKALNTCAVVVAVLAGVLPVALVVAVAQLLLKLWSAWRVLAVVVPWPLRPAPAAAAVPTVRTVPAAVPAGPPSGASAGLLPRPRRG